MEAHIIIMKLHIILFGESEMVSLVSNLIIGLTQFWSPNLFNYLARILTLPIKYERHSWNFLEFCQHEQMHLVWNFGKVLFPFNVFHCLQYLI